MIQIPIDKFNFSIAPYPKPKGCSCTFENLDNFWETDFKKGKSSYKAFKDISANITINYAVDKWLETKSNPETRRKYWFAIEKLFNKFPYLKLDDTINSLDQSSADGVYEYILENEELDISKNLRQLCSTAYAQLCDFIRTRTRGLINPDLLPKEKKAFYKTKGLYKSIDWKEFTTKIETPFNLLAEMIYLAAVENAFRIRISDARQNALNLTTDQVCFESNSVCFKEGQSYHNIPLCITYSLDFIDRLKEHIGNQIGLVFTNRVGRVLVPKTIERAFKRTSQTLNLPEVVMPTILTWAGAIQCQENWLNERKELDKKLLS